MKSKKRDIEQSLSGSEFKEMVLSIAHDFNNLLVGILGNARILNQDNMVSPEGQKLVKEILSCAERSAHLSNKLLKAGETYRSEAVSQVLPQQEGAAGSPGWEEARRIVLIVDDEEVVRNVSTAILERAGYRVIATGSGREGISIFENYSDEIRCVLLDLTMPYISGNLIFARMKAADPDVKILLMSGYSDKQAFQEFGARTIEGFIQKPFEPEELLNAVRSVKQPVKRREQYLAAV